ncbi:hypothetical protein [Herbiconiux liukaitaii]|uniref:hypothetical protein n=1 Tax=Herbiconiux liukaitaii TaxID=3342799 RepID=UPI0035BA3CCE
MRATRRGAVSALVLSAVVALSGCAPAESDIAAGTSSLMQSTIVTAAEQAAAGDTAAALATLDSLQAQLQQASADGDVSTARAASIQQSIDTVRADLQPVTEPAPAETVPTETAPAETEEPVVDPPATDPGAPAPGEEDGDDAEDEDDGGPGNNGNGNEDGSPGNSGKDKKNKD